MTSLRLLLLLVYCAAATSGDYMPVFLFAGQSNMVGVAGQAGNHYQQATGMPGLSLQSLLPIITQKYQNKTKRRKRRLEALTEELLKVEPTAQDAKRARRAAIALLDMKIVFRKMFRKIQNPLSDVYCSWTRPVKAPNALELRVATNLSPAAGCGSPWGPELTFGHTLVVFNEFAIAKAAQGGTEIYRNWTKVAGTDYGECWDALQSRVQNIQSVHPKCASGGGCRWQGLVYFQGENDSFHIDKALGYGGNLTNLISSSRREMFSAGADYTFATPQDIPVVIVQLGCWPNGLSHGPIVMKAQADYVANTPNAALVKTSDLSCFYHFDDASILIIGDRIARAMDSLLSSQQCGLQGATCEVNEDCCRKSCRRRRCKL